ncbi:hypothetical protein ACWELB_20810 [Streptomyces asiaticus]
MSSPIDIAERRAAASSDPDLFLAAFHAGRQAGPGEDTDAYVRALITQGEHVAVAGYLEGLASRRELPAGVHASNCGCTPCRLRRDMRAYTERLRLGCRKQVSA